jgi:hypothetical protein
MLNEHKTNISSSSSMWYFIQRVLTSWIMSMWVRRLYMYGDKQENHYRDTGVMLNGNTSIVCLSKTR